MFPLNPDLLLMVKFFVVLTCIFFWIKLLYDAVKRSVRMHSHHDE